MFLTGSINKINKYKGVSRDENTDAGQDGCRMWEQRTVAGGRLRLIVHAARHVTSRHVACLMRCNKRLDVSIECSRLQKLRDRMMKMQMQWCCESNARHAECSARTTLRCAKFRVGTYSVVRESDSHITDRNRYSIDSLYLPNSSATICLMSIRSASTLSTFENILKTHLFSRSYFTD